MAKANENRLVVFDFDDYSVLASILGPLESGICDGEKNYSGDDASNTCRIVINELTLKRSIGTTGTIELSLAFGFFVSIRHLASLKANPIPNGLLKIQVCGNQVC